ncbi:MAG TPA: hypothetical protein VF961_04865 [Pyrinomonadaceae bacterium]
MVHKRVTVVLALARTMFFVLAVWFSHHTVVAQSSNPNPQPAPSPDNSSSEQSQQSKQGPKDPIENADGYKSKLTFGIYFTPGSRAYDLNLRHRFGPFTAWIAGFYDPRSNKLLRVGAQYDYRKAWLHLVPTLEVSTTRAMSGSLYSELGSGNTVAIVGVSRTNLRAFFDLFWDPGDAVQLGFAHRLSSYDSISAYTIFDVRLHTQQQNTHLVWRQS